jgi:SAM-dependent methyltransferase
VGLVYRAVQKFLAQNPFAAPNQPGIPSATQPSENLVANQIKQIRRTRWDVKIDHQFSSNHKIYGRYSQMLLKTAPADARLTVFDLSVGMLSRARNNLDCDRVFYAAAEVTRLPFADQSFDAAVCGWVLEHLPDPRPALYEFHRVMQSGAKFLLMCTEDTWTGAVCSRLWHCRTYNRRELGAACETSGFSLAREHWFSPLHRSLKLGGVIVELTRN